MRPLLRPGLRGQLGLLASLCVILVLAPLLVAGLAWSRIGQAQAGMEDAQQLDRLVREAQARQEAWLRLRRDEDAAAVTAAVAAGTQVLDTGRLEAEGRKAVQEGLQAYAAAFTALQTAIAAETALERDFTAATASTSERVSGLLKVMLGLRGRAQMEGEDFGAAELGVLNQIRDCDIGVNRLHALYQRFLRSEETTLLDRFAEVLAEDGELSKAIFGMQLNAALVKGIDLPPMVAALEAEMRRWAGMPARAKLLLAERQSAATTATAAGSDIVLRTTDAIATARRRVATTERNAIVIWISLSAAGLLGFALVAVGVVRSITRRVGRAARLAGLVGQGDLTARLGDDLGDEIGRMSGSLDQALDGMAGAVRAIGGNAAGVQREAASLDALAVRLDASASSTSERALSASTAAQQVAASMATVAAAVQELDASIAEIARSAQQGAATAADGSRTVAEAAAGMQRLTGASEAIGGVLDLIKGIATQVDLLALNATIEAARAGAAGRGFAVVASEVKALARRTSTAVEEVSRHLLAMRQEVGDNHAAIARTSTLMQRIDEMQQTAASAVEEQAATTREMGAAVQQAAAAAREIAAIATAVADGAKDTGASATAAKQAAAELARMADDLTASVKRFIV